MSIDKSTKSPSRYFIEYETNPLLKRIFGENYEHVYKFMTLCYNKNKPNSQVYIENYDFVKNMYWRTYVPVSSDKQIATIIRLTKYSNLQDYHRLIQLLTKWIKPNKIKAFLKNAQKLTSDKAIYSLMKKYLKYDQESKYSHSRIRNIATANAIYQFLIRPKNLLHAFQLVDILDLGCTNGKKVGKIGRELGLSSKNIHGADIEDWYGLQKKRSSEKFNFIKLVENERFPIESNRHNLIIFQMTLHHINKLDWYMRELNRITAMHGYLYIREHDVFTDIDYMLVDIEHAMYLSIVNKEPLKDYYGCYFDWIELHMILLYYGFERLRGGEFSDSVRSHTSITRRSFSIYYKVKDIIKK